MGGVRALRVGPVGNNTVIMRAYGHATDMGKRDHPLAHLACAADGAMFMFVFRNNPSGTALLSSSSLDSPTTIHPCFFV